MNESYTWIYLVDILPAFATTEETFESNFLVGADVFYFWYDADIYEPVFSLVVWSEWALADPLDAAFQSR